jgi:hypothetical protein
VTDTMEPVGQDVDREAADELVGVERHGLVAVVGLGQVILPFERVRAFQNGLLMRFALTRGVSLILEIVQTQPHVTQPHVFSNNLI